MGHRHTGRSSGRVGFTLVEVVVSVAIMSILMTALGSLMVVSSRALPNPDDPASAIVTAGTAMCWFSDDAHLASRVTEASGTAFEFEVADRDGDSIDETIRYSWSGTPGDPLVRTLNGDKYDVLAEHVQSLSFEYETVVSTSPRRVLLVVPDSASLNAEDTRRRQVIESWGHTVTPISASATQAEYDAAIEDCDVAYVSEESDSTEIGTKLTAATIGVVTEEGMLYDELGISSSASAFTNNTILILNNSHPVTSGLGLTLVTIMSSSQDLLTMSGSKAPGATGLAQQPLILGTALAVIERGDQLYTGDPAPNRRVKLPWGNTGGFDISALNGNGLLLMQNSIEWAGETNEIVGVRLTISGVTGSSATVQRRVSLLNAPTEPVP